MTLGMTAPSADVNSGGMSTNSIAVIAVARVNCARGQSA